MPFNKLNNKKIILASGSPRRQQFLKDLGLNFKIKLREIDESYPKGLKAEDIAIFISEKKASAFDDLLENEVLITSDTIVWINDKALGKPKDEEDAKNMLKELSGNMHEVITAFTLKTTEKTISEFASTKVFFNELTDEEINYYVDNFKPMDKAGSYGIQEWIGLIGISKIEGSYNNVVGLPVDMVYQALLEI
jgi:septum formation protein